MSHLSHIVVALPKQAEAEKIKSLLVQRGYIVDGAFQSGNQALCLLYNFDEGIIITGYRCADMVYGELKEQLPDMFSMILIASPDIVDDAPSDIYGITKPLHLSELTHAIDMCEEQIRRQKRRKTGARSRSDRDMAIIDMAKQSIMAVRHLTEPEAYRYLQKFSMDCKRTLEESAKLYLLSVEN